MTDANLTQAEADTLLKLEKWRVDSSKFDYPCLGGQISASLVSSDGNEMFLLDVRRSQLNLSKGTYQNRCRKIVVLARFDFGGAPHRNPDGEEIGTPHLHLYRENYGDKWAYRVPNEGLSITDDPWSNLQEFMRFCNITKPPNIEKGLFL